MFYCMGNHCPEPSHGAEDDLRRDAPAPCGKSRQPKRNSSGQAVVEYVLTVALLTLVFGTVFYKMRLALFDLWVCQLAPRIQAPRGCGNNTNECWSKVQPEGEVNQRCKIN